LVLVPAACSLPCGHGRRRRPRPHQFACG